MYVMGILNVTPDSFADGGLHFSHEDAIAHALQMVDDGADIIDVGGESTRPGAERVSEAEEQDRVIPVIQALAARKIRVSVDTMRASTASQAVAAGAEIVNDVSGGAADPDMFKTVASLDCPYILMHWRGHSKEMNAKAIYGDVVKEVIAEISGQLGKALEAGIKPSKIIIDPGIGFAKDADHNWELINRMPELIAMGYPILIGHSRKRFLGGERPEDREEATVNLTKSLVDTGIWGVRVHGVRANVEAIRS
jgi:dihydropteroate synthase